MATLVIEWFYSGNPVGTPQEVAVTGTALAGGSRITVPGNLGSPLFARLSASGSSIIVSQGTNPTASATEGILVPEGQSRDIRVYQGQLLSAVTTTLLSGVTGGNTSLASIDGKLPATLGQKAKAASLAVVLASDQDVLSVTQVSGAPAVVSATIGNGASLSAAIDLGSARLSRIAMPSAWTAAVLTFQVSPDGVTYNDFYDQYGVEVTAQAAASRSIVLDPVYWYAVRYLKIRSGTSAAAVNQAADRTLTLVTVPG